MKSPFVVAIEKIHEQALQRPLCLSEIVDALGVQSQKVLIVFLCLPFMQPLPLPGLSTILGALIASTAMLSFLGKPTFLPKKFAHRQISQSVLLKTTEVADRFLLKIERWIHPRGKWFLNSKTQKFFSCFMVIVMGLLLALPLPIPFTNTVPALVIMVNTFGQLEEDAIFVGMSHILFFAALSFFSSIIWGIDVWIQFFQ